MTPQEQHMLNDLLNRLAAAPAPQRDMEADAMIQKTIATRPDALYLLTQTALIHEIALKNASAQIQDMQQKIASRPQPQQSTFAGQGGPWAQQPAMSPQPQYQQPQPQYQPQPQAQPSGMGSFLHSALTTATGVVAGEAAFSAIHSLFGGSGGGIGGGSAAGNSFLSDAPRSETVINNYYGNDSDNGNSNSDDTTNYAIDDNDDSTDFSSDDSSSDFS